METVCVGRRTGVEAGDKDAATVWNDYWSKIKDFRKPNGEMNYANLITIVAVMASFPCCDGTQMFQWSVSSVV